ncbi:AfsR/SARP family transcriptional regulator [Amycolatopsis suaedae]|uniref:Tetratricopeptide repeat protein n=1 Tax=Amycolatopsis suaedae TaxID=2510978 RepID=A0A4Q7IXW4_9PSEU|nr:tetratricopeptide repeat protein [Amycolatopsis suaedae]RZQ59268.1 tetratricopeptide repeat protein [Amycolatopsis suaedae]
MLEFGVLGQLDVRAGGRRVPLGGRLRRTLLAVLLSRANEPVPVDLLADAVWDGEPGDRAAPKLQLHVHRLRQALGSPGRLTFANGAYRLTVLPGELDAERFDTLVGDATGTGDPDRRVALLRDALALWRGAPFGDLDAPLLTACARRLEGRRLLALEDLYQAELARGRHELVAAELTTLTREHPGRERLHQLLRIAQHRTPAVPAQLPPAVRGFTGRTGPLTTLDDLLADDAPPVCALVGTAGVGKTSLAVRWAHRVSKHFPDGQLYLDLRGYDPRAPVTPADALGGFLRSLGVDGPSVPQSLAERAARFAELTGNRRLLLILDNARTAEQVRHLLPSPSCRTVITSRDALTDLTGPVRRLDLGRLPDDEAGQLLRTLLGTRADASPRATTALIERCARLPLALRIAAESLHGRDSVADLVAQLADGHDSLDVLDAGGDPQAAVRAVFSWSYEQLPGPARRLFRLWGLHPGRDAEAEALAALCGTDVAETRAHLDVLVRAHLAEEDLGRYRTHDLLRAYALELTRVEDSPADRSHATDRLLDWTLTTAHDARQALDPHAAGPAAPATRVFTGSAEALHWFTDEQAAIRAAVRTAADRGRHDLAWRLASSFRAYCYLTKHWDDWIATHRIGLSAATAAGDRHGQADMHNGLGVAHSDRDEHTAAIEHHLAAAEHYRTLDVPRGAAWNLNNLGVTYHDIGRVTEAVDCYGKALELFRRAGDSRGEGFALNNLGDAYRDLGDVASATDRLRQALEVHQRAGDRDGQRFALRTLGDVHRDTGAHGEALRHYRRSLAICQDIGDRWHAATVYTRLGAVLEALGRTAAAVNCDRRAAALRNEFSDHLVDGR